MRRPTPQTPTPPATPNSEWQEWAGGRPPVAPGAVVEVRFRNGRTDTRVAGRVEWHTTGSAGGDIVAWRLI